MTNDELENRLIDFSLSILEISKDCSKSQAAIYLSQQVIRSGISPALNYAEARGAESRKDFIHKLRISLKELRETYVSLKIIERGNLMTSNTSIQKHINECNELISIFVSSIKTCQK